MSQIRQEIGCKIRSFRKARGMTLDDLAAGICRSKSTLSKYEKGEIALDVETLYEIAQVLRIHVEQLLCPNVLKEPSDPLNKVPGFFRGLTKFYAYAYDGRSNQILRSVYEVSSPTEEHRYRVSMYLNFSDFSNYQHCENSYSGYIEHFSAVTNIVMTNQSSPMEHAFAQILASYLDAPTIWGLFCSLSTRPMMPVTAKMLYSKKQLAETEKLVRQLKVNREDIRLLKLYNMMCVM